MMPLQLGNLPWNETHDLSHGKPGSSINVVSLPQMRRWGPCFNLIELNNIAANRRRDYQRICGNDKKLLRERHGIGNRASHIGINKPLRGI